MKEKRTAATGRGNKGWGVRLDEARKEARGVGRGRSNETELKR